MSWTAVDNAIIKAIADIGLTAFAVYVVLQMHVNDAGECWPSIQTIAKTIGLSSRAVQYAIGRLCAAGLIVKTERPGRATLYRLTPATSCTPSADGDAPDCTIPLQPVAPGGAPSCTTPLQLRAPRTIPIEQDSHNNTHGTTTKARGKAAAVVEIPEGLDCEEFQEAWARWSKHRKEIRQSLTPSTTAAQLKKLGAWGVTRAVAAIDHSIEKGWKGIFEESSNGNGNGKARGFRTNDSLRSGTGNGKPPAF